jgi:hypothetical protein
MYYFFTVNESINKRLQFKIKMSRGNPRERRANGLPARRTAHAHPPAVRWILF